MRLVLTLALVAVVGCKKGDDTPEPTPVPTPVPIDADGDGYAEDVDCDDADPEVHPDAPELCDGVDNDCDGAVDDDVVTLDWYDDADQDGFGDASGAAESSCAPVAGRVDDATDCDDADASVRPDAAEICNGVDDDCSGTADDGLTFQDWFTDDDGDGYGDASDTPVSACEDVAGRVLDATDCDDADADVSPAATEVCDGVDQDCDGSVDEGVLSTFSVDLDGDGYGAEVEACADPDGPGTEVPGDCDDGAASVFPGAPELCDGADSDCAGGTPEHAVPAEFATIQDAVDAASAGDIVCIAAGTYTENVTASVSLRIEGTGADEVVLDGGGLGRVLGFESGATVIELEGLTLRNGLASEGAGLRVADAAATTVLTDVRIEDNVCDTGPCTGAGAKLVGDVDLVDVVVEGNTIDLATDANAVGAGLHLSTGVVTGSNVSLLGNHSTTVGAIWIEGAGLYAQDVDLVLTDSRIAGNGLTGGQTRGHGFSTAGGTVLIERTVIEDNTAYGDTWPYPAKGVVHMGSPAVLRNVVIARNDADAASGDILGTVFTVYGLFTLEVEHTTIVGNTGTASWSSLVDGNNNTVTFSHVVAWDNEGSATLYGAGSPVFDHSLVGTSGFLANAIVNGTANLTEVDPLFVDEANGDYHLGAGSPAIDAGDAAILDPDGTTADLGAYGGPGAP
ncbi:MAG: hypothetical protein H6737_22605 [Alphaproteobacteria bacterium]|nr:hypothetical protein [Alphaproteobacteria bacterium]